MNLTVRPEHRSRTWFGGWGISLPERRKFSLVIAERFRSTAPVPHLLRPSTGTSAAPANVPPQISRSSMTVEQFIADLDELVDTVGTRVGQNKVAIMNKEAGVVGELAQRAGRTGHVA